MTVIAQLFAQFDVILVAIMLSGFLVKMGKHLGIVRGNSQFKRFYLLFGLLILENAVIVLVSNYFFLPLFEQPLFNTYLRIGAITATLILLFNIWYTWTFEYKQKWTIIASLAIATIITILLFSYSIPF